MRVVLLSLSCLLLLSGCGMPDPHFCHSPWVRVLVGPDTFDVRRRGRLAEAVRRNSRYAPRLGPVGPRAARAMALVTGCRVSEIRGDAAMILGILDCGDGVGQAAAADRQKLPPEDCEIVESWRQLGGQELALVLDCTRI